MTPMLLKKLKGTVLVKLAWAKKKKYEKKFITDVLTKYYNISPTIVNLSFWSYTTTVYYVKDDKNNTYIVKISTYSLEKLQNLKKDMYFSKFFAKKLPVPTYIKNKDNEYLTCVETSIIRVAKYIPGTSPFDMNIDILKQIVEYLNTIHNTPLNDIKIDLPVVGTTKKTTKLVLLHGDLTESNTVVADNKVVEIMDFEYTCIGPSEYDLAKTSLFCWLRMKHIPYTQVVKITIEAYKGKVNKSEIFKYAQIHIHNHINEIMRNKDSYIDKNFWDEDLAFFRNTLEQIQAIKV